MPYWNIELKLIMEEVELKSKTLCNFYMILIWFIYSFLFCECNTITYKLSS